MKDLVERIYEGFYQNVSSTTLSEELDSITYYRYDWLGDHKKIADEFQVLKNSGWYIDTLCDALLRNCKRSSFYEDGSIRFGTIEMYPKSSLSKYKKYTSHPDWYRRDGDLIILPECIEVDFRKLYADDSVNKTIAKIADVKNNMGRSVTIYAAYVMATLKGLGLLDEDAKFDDLKDDSLFIVGQEVNNHRFIFSKPALVRPPKGLSSSFDSSVTDAYNNTLKEIKELQRNLEILRDNEYPLNAMTDKTIRDISSRCSVIAKLASKFRK